MRLQTDHQANWQASGLAALPPSPDSETLALLRTFLAPILETADSWKALSDALAEKGYGIAFLEGHLVIRNADTGDAICTGQALGTPLKSISARIGRPCVKAHSDGHSGDLG